MKQFKSIFSHSKHSCKMRSLGLITSKRRTPNFIIILINLQSTFQLFWLGCLNWIALRARPDIAWATSRAVSLSTHGPDTCFIRVKHIVSISTSYLGLCVAMCSNSSTVQAQTVGIGRCLLCTGRGEESTRCCCLSWYHLQSTKRW